MSGKDVPRPSALISRPSLSKEGRSSHAQPALSASHARIDRVRWSAIFLTLLGKWVSRRSVGTPELLGEVCRKALGARYGDPDGWAFELVSRGGGRSVLSASQKSSGRRVAVKFNGSNQKNREQFRALDGMHRAGVDCVRPLFFDDEGRFLVLEWVDAPLLIQELASPQRNALILKSGQWLARLQQSTVGSAKLLSKVRSMRIPKSDGDETIAEASARLKKRMKRANLPRKELVKLHGDFHVENVFCAPDRLPVFDPHFDGYGNPFEDAARFLLSLALSRQVAAEAGRPWPGDAEMDRWSFFGGYGALRNEHIGLYDLIEDYIYFTTWLRHRRRRPDCARCRFLERELKVRGVLDSANTGPRPGRLAVGPGGTPIWTRESAAAIQRGWISSTASRASSVQADLPGANASPNAPIEEPSTLNEDGRLSG